MTLHPLRPTVRPAAVLGAAALLALLAGCSVPTVATASPADLADAASTALEQETGEAAPYDFDCGADEVAIGEGAVVSCDLAAEGGTAPFSFTMTDVADGAFALAVVSGTVPEPETAPEPEPEPTPDGGDGDETNVFALAVGDCIVDATDEEEVTNVQVIDCASPHTFEVYHEFELPEGGYPADLDTQADTGCYDAFAGFMGVSYEESIYGYTWYSPTQESWDSGDRLVSCLVADPSDAPVTGSLRGSGL